VKCDDDGKINEETAMERSAHHLESEIAQQRNTTDSRFIAFFLLGGLFVVTIGRAKNSI